MQAKIIALNEPARRLPNLAILYRQFQRGQISRTQFENSINLRLFNSLLGTPPTSQMTRFSDVIRKYMSLCDPAHSIPFATSLSQSLIKIGQELSMYYVFCISNLAEMVTTRTIDAEFTMIFNTIIADSMIVLEPQILREALSIWLEAALSAHNRTVAKLILVQVQRSLSIAVGTNPETAATIASVIRDRSAVLGPESDPDRAGILASIANRLAHPSPPPEDDLLELNLAALSLSNLDSISETDRFIVAIHLLPSLSVANLPR